MHGSFGRFALAFVPAAFLMIACSGSTSDLLTGTAGNSSGGASSGGASSGGASSGGASSGGASSGGASSGGASSGGASSGGASSSGGTTSSSGGVVDAGGVDPDVDAVYCGKESSGKEVYCAGNDVCCGKRNNGQISFVGFTCTSVGQCPVQGNTAPFGCDDRNDCASGQRCCGAGSYSGTSFVYVGSSCRNSCPTGVVLCDPRNANECGNGSSCQPSAILANGQHVCQN